MCIFYSVTDEQQFFCLGAAEMNFTYWFVSSGRPIDVASPAELL